MILYFCDFIQNSWIAKLSKHFGVWSFEFTNGNDSKGS